MNQLENYIMTKQEGPLPKYYVMNGALTLGGTY